MGRNEDLLSFLKKRYPDAHCSLIFSNDFECLVAVLCSAQTSDASVNKVTPFLFAKYKDPSSLMKADIADIEDCIHSLGLYRNKAKSLQKMGEFIVFNYRGEIPHDLEKLRKIPGVGEKTARVFLLERSDIPFIPVDTHLDNIAKRLGYAYKNDSPLTVEKKLEKNFPSSEWRFLHHALIEFGRDICRKGNPRCELCPLQQYCLYFKKCSSMIGK